MAKRTKASQKTQIYEPGKVVLMAVVVAVLTLVMFASLVWFAIA